jgi:chromosome segregation ATPase
MENTLEELNIDYSADEEIVSEPVENIDVTEEVDAAEDNGVEMLNELQEALQRQQELEAEVRSLQEKLSVCYTKESRYSDRLSKANSAVTAQEIENKTLSEQVTTLTTKVNELTECVNKLTTSDSAKSEEIKQLTESVEGYRTRYTAMKAKLSDYTTNKVSLNESLNSKTAEVTKLTESYNQLKESSEKKLKEAYTRVSTLESTNTKLTEELKQARTDNQIIKSQSAAKQEKSEVLVEKYKSIAKTAVEKYMSSQATRIGVSVSDIKSRLHESYSFKDIDKVVEDLQQYKVNLNSLPFTTMIQKRPTKMTIRESKEPLLNLKDNSLNHLDDNVDEALLTFTN